MALEETPKRVEQDIENGDPGKAKNHLHDLISIYLENIQLRRKLGEIYCVFSIQKWLVVIGTLKKFGMESGRSPQAKALVV